MRGQLRPGAPALCGGPVTELPRGVRAYVLGVPWAALLLGVLLLVLTPPDGADAALAGLLLAALVVPAVTVVDPEQGWRRLLVEAGNVEIEARAEPVRGAGDRLGAWPATSTCTRTTRSRG